MIEAIPPTVIAFKTIQNAGKGPVLPSREAVKCQGVRCAFFPSERRISRIWPATWLVDGARSQGIAVVKMLIEILRAFHVVDYGDCRPRYIERIAYARIARLITDEGRATPADFNSFACLHLAPVQTGLVLTAKRFG